MLGQDGERTDLRSACVLDSPSIRGEDRPEIRLCVGPSVGLLWSVLEGPIRTPCTLHLLTPPYNITHTHTHPPVRYTNTNIRTHVCLNACPHTHTHTNTHTHTTHTHFIHSTLALMHMHTAQLPAGDQCIQCTVQYAVWIM